MKKTILIALLLITSIVASAQKIKHFEAYLRYNDMSTRYVAVLQDNSIWWFAPGQAWEKSSVKGLPAGYDIKILSAYARSDGSSRYVVVLKDNTIWWFAPGQAWEKSSLKGLPKKNIKELKAYTKSDGTRYVVVLDDNSIWWFAPGQEWQRSSVAGLPKN